MMATTLITFQRVFRLHFFVLLFLNIQCRGEINFSKSIRPSTRLRAPTFMIRGEHISLEFYSAIEYGENAKNNLQSLLNNFFENLQRNLSTSSILNAVSKTIDTDVNCYQLEKLNDLANYFQHSSETAGEFSHKAETFFEISKNESYSLLLKLRQLPSAQHLLPVDVKMHLTDYFAEMEFFQVMFSEVIDEALEFIVDKLQSIQKTFIRYADIQRDILRKWDFKSDEWCCNTYTDFLQEWSVHIFKCAASTHLHVVYDVYAISEITTKYIMQQLEFRIQRLYNCFIFGNYEMRCKFLRNPEQDFEKLLINLDELQQYFDIKIKKGRVSTYRTRRHRQKDDFNLNVNEDKCIPNGFPNIQIMSTLKMCFNFPNSNFV